MDRGTDLTAVSPETETDLTEVIRMTETGTDLTDFLLTIGTTSDLIGNFLMDDNTTMI
jgi:hypothetical protein